MLDSAAIKKVCEEAWPRATNPDELHEAFTSPGSIDGRGSEKSGR